MARGPQSRKTEWRNLGNASKTNGKAVLFALRVGVAPPWSVRGRWWRTARRSETHLRGEQPRKSSVGSTVPTLFHTGTVRFSSPKRQCPTSVCAARLGERRPNGRRERRKDVVLTGTTQEGSVKQPRRGLELSTHHELELLLFQRRRSQSRQAKRTQQLAQRYCLCCEAV